MENFLERIHYSRCHSEHSLFRGMCVAQSVKRPTLDFGSGHDLTVCGIIEPGVELCANSAEPAWDSLSPPLSLPLPSWHACTLTLSQNK